MNGKRFSCLHMPKEREGEKGSRNGSDESDRLQKNLPQPPLFINEKKKRRPDDDYN